MKNVKSYWFWCSDGRNMRKHGTPKQACNYCAFLNSKDTATTWEYKFNSNGIQAMSTEIKEDEEN